MELTKKRTSGVLFVKVDGRIDTNTAAEFGTQVSDDMDDIKELVIDFEGVDYISSIGLRVLLEFQKRMNEQGAMRLKNVQKAVMEVFDMTGFSNILTIE